jgi:hypothetical protein
MIRGSVLPLQRDGLWRLIRQRTGLFERGFRVVAEQIELGTAGLPPVDGLVRDAGGAPVLVFATDDRDPSLCARVLAAHAFWTRNAEGMSRALPEADLRDGSSCRLLVVGVAMRVEAVAALQRLQLPGLEIVEVDAFRLAGQERIVVRSLSGHVGKPEGAPLDGAVGAGQRSVFDAFEQFVRRLDPKIRVEGDRFSRRASYEGRLLGDFWYADESVHALVCGGASRRIDSDAELRSVCDQLARRYLQVHGPAEGEADSEPAPGRMAPAHELAVDGDETQFPAHGLEAVRSCLTNSKLSREERDALLDPAFGREQEERNPGS